MTSKSIVTHSPIVLHHPPCPPHHHCDDISSHSGIGGGVQAVVATVTVVEAAKVDKAAAEIAAVVAVGLGLVELVVVITAKVTVEAV
eukprot:47568-Ditylum_brightwellii.AAC.1